MFCGVLWPTLALCLTAMAWGRRAIIRCGDLSNLLDADRGPRSQPSVAGRVQYRDLDVLFRAEVKLGASLVLSSLLGFFS